MRVSAVGVKLDRGDQLVATDVRVARRVVGQTMEAPETASCGRRRGRAGGSSRRSSASRREKSDGVHRDAPLGRSEDRHLAVVAADRAAAAARPRACCTAARRRGSTTQRVRCSTLPPIDAMLRSCADALRFSAIATAGAPRAHRGVVGGVAHPRQRADPHAAVGRDLDRSERQGAMSISVPGCATSSLMRSTMFVPPARKPRADLRERRDGIVRARVRARTRTGASGASRGGLHRRDDVRVGAAAADVAAHALDGSRRRTAFAFGDQPTPSRSARACNNRTGSASYSRNAACTGCS